MRNVPVVAVPASQLNRSCVHCSRPIEDFISRSVCAECGLPQALDPSEDYFSVLGFSRQFGLSLSEVEKRFYKLLRMLHPDRYTTSSAAIQDLSLQRMSFVNQAYGVLKDRESLRGYLIELVGIESNTENSKVKQKNIPLDLAEQWFEIQESLMEHSELAQEQLRKFENEVRSRLQQLDDTMATLEAEYDSQGAAPVLNKIEELPEVDVQGY